MVGTVKIYGPPAAPAVSRVLACLHEKKVHFENEIVHVNMAKGEHKCPDHLKIQPFGQVPVFEDESITLFESRAICRYVCHKYEEQGTKGLYGTNPLERASIDQWLEAEGQNFNPPSEVLIFQLVCAPLMNINQDENLIKQNETELAQVLDVYDKRLGEYQYLAGHDFTLADLSHLPNAHYLFNRTDVQGLLSSRHNVQRWWDEISCRESWRRVLLQSSPPGENDTSMPIWPPE